ncbi:hypothetical protein BC332_18593 [Capsicum chinense]|nr:hypothetical protein BC332_18593 [Capsicum chinense]
MVVEVVADVATLVTMVVVGGEYVDDDDVLVIVSVGGKVVVGNGGGSGGETDNDRDDSFIFNINGKDLHFRKREFSVVNGLKYFKKSDFVFDPKVRNKLMDRYYPGMNKVMSSVFYDDFVNKKIVFRDEDLYEIELVYFISRFLHFELPRTFIKKADFDLVESGHYLKYDWEDIDKCVANLIGSQTPRILNWESSEELIFMTIFRVQCSSGTAMSDIVFTDEEELEFNFGVIHQDSLGHEHRNDSNHSVPSIIEDAFSVLKNEIANVDSQFNGMREFVEESVKLILNELRFVKQQSSEFVEKKNVDIGLQTPPVSKKQNQVLVDPVIEKYFFCDDVSVPLDVSNNPVVNNPVNDQSPFDDIPFFTECLYVYDSMMGGVVHSKNVLDHVRSHSTMIPLFLVTTNFYGKRSDIDWYRKAAYIDKSLSEPLNDCGMFVCAFAEYVSHGIFDISSTLFGVVNHRLRYGALLWDYAKRKQNDGAVSESEATENITSKHGGFKRSRKQFGSSRTR